MNKNEKDCCIDMLCTSYDKEDLLDAYFDDFYTSRHLDELKNIDKRILKEAIEKFDNDSFRKKRCRIDKDVKINSFTITMSVDNYATEMDCAEIEEYLKKVLRYALISVKDIKSKLSN